MTSNNDILSGYNAKTLKELCANLKNLAQPQFDFACEAARSLLPADVMKRVDRIVVSGCGDSFLASAGAAGAFEKYLGDCRVEAPRIVNASRHLPFEENEPNTLVIAVSATGGAARVAELLERGKKHGCITVALTNRAESRGAKTADYVYLTNTTPDSPGLGSFYASLLSLIALAAVMGEVRTGADNTTALREELLSYNKAFFEDFDAICATCQEVARQWTGMKGFEVVADGPLFFTGEFVAAKYAEASGDLCSVIDSENYLHVNGMLAPTDAYGTIVMAVSDEANITRVVDTAKNIINRDKRSVLFVCDKPHDQVGMEATPAADCVIKVPRAEYRFLLPLYAIVPGSLMAGYQAELLGETYFRGFRTVDPSAFTIATSKVVVL